MAGLASGLSMIHNFKTTIALAPEGGFTLPDDGIKLAVQTGEEMFGRHGDIKPENILWFKRPLDIEQQDGMGVLQLTDFGLGRFHGRESRSNVNPKSIYNSPTYEPPECKLEVPVTRKYDMWSLGCLYLEFVTWLLEGEKNIEEFSNNRGARGDPFILINGKEFEVVRDPVINDDNFFTILRDDDKEKSAIVRQAVVDWVDHLRTTKRCSLLIHELLDLIMKDLLKPYFGQRTDAVKLNVIMQDLVRKAEKREDYLLKPVPWALPQSSLPKPISQGLLSSKHVKFSETWPSGSR
jgi:serine/threonine protein kinase